MFVEVVESFTCPDSIMSDGHCYIPKERSVKDIGGHFICLKELQKDGNFTLASKIWFTRQNTLKPNGTYVAFSGRSSYQKMSET